MANIENKHFGASRLNDEERAAYFGMRTRSSSKSPVAAPW